MSRTVVAISDLPAIAQNNPEALPILRVVVYDKEGTPSKIRAIELDRFLSLGFTAEPPPDVEAVIIPPEPFVPPQKHHIVQSFRVGPHGGN